MNIFRSRGPIVVRRNNLNLPLPFVPQAMSEPRALNVSPELPRSSEEQQGPTVVEFSLPQLLSKVNSLLPQLSQGRPRVMEISINRNPFADFQSKFQSEFQPEPELNFPELPRMVEGLFGRKDNSLEPLIEEVEHLFGDEEPEDDLERFMEEDMFPSGESLFGHKDDDVEPLGGFGGLFEQINNQFGRMMSSLPQVKPFITLQLKLPSPSWFLLTIVGTNRRLYTVWRGNITRLLSIRESPEPDCKGLVQSIKDIF